MDPDRQAKARKRLVASAIVLAQGAIDTFRRFPLAVVCAFLATLAALCAEHEVQLFGSLFPETYQDTNLRILGASAWGVFLFAVLKLLKESRGWLGHRHYALESVGLLLVLWYFFGGDVTLPMSGAGPWRNLTSFFFLSLALFLALTFAPFLTKGSDFLAFWSFNLALAQRIALAVLFGAVIYLGLLSAIFAVDYLFTVGFSGHPYMDTWTIVTGVFGPWFVLSGLQKSYTGDEAIRFPRGLKFFAQYIMVPLVVIYFVILYAYMARIAIFAELPKGTVATLVISYSIVGIITFLLLYPFRADQETRWATIYVRLFYWALIPLIGLLMLAIGSRIAAYGVTEDRYSVAMLAAWLAGMVVYFLVWRRPDIRAVPVSLCVLLIVGSFGPWGAYGLSQSSQVRELEALLVSNGILVDGRVRPVHANVGEYDQGRINSVVKYLVDTCKAEAVRSWFVDVGLDITKATEAREIVMAMGLNYEADRGSLYSFPFKTQNRLITDLDGFDILIRFEADIHGKSWHETIDVPQRDKKYELTFDPLTNVMTIRSRIDVVEFDVNPLIAKLRKESPDHEAHPPQDLSLEAMDGDLRVRLHLQGVDLWQEQDRLRVKYIDSLLFIRDAPPK